MTGDRYSGVVSDVDAEFVMNFNLYECKYLNAYDQKRGRRYAFFMATVLNTIYGRVPNNLLDIAVKDGLEPQKLDLSNGISAAIFCYYNKALRFTCNTCSLRGDCQWYRVLVSSAKLCRRS